MWLKTSLHRAKRVNAKALDREALKYLEKLAYPDPDEWNPEEWLAYQREMYLVCRKAAKLLRAEQHRNENYYWANQPNNEEDSNRYEGYNPTDELPYNGN
jgi:hypothetical protein